MILFLFLCYGVTCGLHQSSFQLNTLEPRSRETYSNKYSVESDSMSDAQIFDYFGYILDNLLWDTDSGLTLTGLINRQLAQAADKLNVQFAFCVVKLSYEIFNGKIIHAIFMQINIHKDFFGHYLRKLWKRFYPS